MSEFYKKKRNLIIRKYKYLGLKERISFYTFRLFMAFLAFVLGNSLSQSITQENCKGGLNVLVLVVIILICYWISKSDNKKHQEDKLSAVSEFVKEPDIDIEIVDALIEELEKYIKKIKTFASWIAGLSATFIILLATLGTNFFIKICDVYLKVVPMDKLLNMNENILDFLNLGVVFLFLFIMVILIIYNVFAIISFVKEQILIFLYDVRYELLLAIKARELN